jgi:hypothetical protein
MWSAKWAARIGGGMQATMTWTIAIGTNEDTRQPATGCRVLH